MSKFTSIPDPTNDPRSLPTVVLALRDAVRELQHASTTTTTFIQRVVGVSTGTGGTGTGGGTGGTSGPSDAVILARAVAVADIWD